MFMYKAGYSNESCFNAISLNGWEGPSVKLSPSS